MGLRKRAPRRRSLTLLSDWICDTELEELLVRLPPLRHYARQVDVVQEGSSATSPRDQGSSWVQKRDFIKIRNVSILVHHRIPQTPERVNNLVQVVMEACSVVPLSYRDGGFVFGASSKHLT